MMRWIIYYYFNIHTCAVSSNPSKKKFLTIKQWTNAFNIYASVGLKYLEEVEGLAAYLGLSATLNTSGGAALYKYSSSQANNKLWLGWNRE